MKNHESLEIKNDKENNNQKFRKVVVLDTVIFYPEHEKILAKMVQGKLKIERVPLAYSKAEGWQLPDGYTIPEDANVVIWPSSLPESFDGISLETHEKLRTAQCWTEAGLSGDIYGQNLMNRLTGADCILTCWTDIPDNVLDQVIAEKNIRAIITWTHEFAHRLNVDKTREAGIYADCVPDYGTDSVAELVFDSLFKLIERNHKTESPAESDEDYTIGILLQLFQYYRKSSVNEKNTRRGKFSHQFHKIGHAQKHYGQVGNVPLDDIIPEKLLEGKGITLIGTVNRYTYLVDVLQKGMSLNVKSLEKFDSDKAETYKLLGEEDDFVLYDSRTLPEGDVALIILMKGDKALDISESKHYDESLKGKTMGIIGLGRIGGKVALIGEVLGLKIRYSGPSKKDTSYEFSDLDDLLEKSDIISVHVPAHQAEGLISAEKIGKIKNGAYFINTSDANATDQESLTKSMVDNKIFAALDVYQGLPTTRTLCLDNENGKVGHSLANHVLTYRAGWKTQESIRVKTMKLLGHMKKALSQNLK